MDDGVVNEFLTESYENLGKVEEDLVVLEKNPSDPKRMAGVFRAIHTIKGTCGFLGFTRLESVAHAGETLLSRLRSGEITLTPEITSALLALVDTLREILGTIEVSRTEGEGDDSRLIATLSGFQSHDPNVASEIPPPPTGPSAAVAPPESAKSLLGPLIADGRLDPEAVTFAAQQQRLGDPRRIGEILVDHGALKPQDILEALIARGEAPASAISEASIRVDVHLLDLLMNLVGELVLARNQMLQFVQSQDLESLPATTQRLNVVTTELQEGIMKTRMQPIANLCNKLPRLVRDVATACGKEVRLEMEGIDTELDRTIIEAIRDPLTHIVRNAVDHGIESRDLRTAAGKPPEGTLALRAYHEGGKVHLEISDDGAGLSVERIREKALRGGMVSQERAPRMSDREWHQMIFLPGFSTADRITSLSGRGVGMDVVKTNIERIGGTVEVDSSPGRGTSFRIRIPLTLAIIPALIVEAGCERYAIPQVNLLELVRTGKEAGTGHVDHAYDAPMYRYRDSLLPLVFLGDALAPHGMERAAPPESLNIVVLHADGVTFGLVVDEIRSSQEIVVKPLAEILRQTAVFSGATILGDGRVALILDVPGLARHAGLTLTRKGEAVVRPSDTTSVPGGEASTLVLFRVGGDWRVALPLSDVARLEEFRSATVETLGGRAVVQYRGGILPLASLHALLDAVTEAPGLRGETIQVVVCESGGGPVGLVVDEILEIVEEHVAATPVDGCPGIRGTAVIRGKVTDLLDVGALLERAGFEPLRARLEESRS